MNDIQACGPSNNRQVLDRDSGAKNLKDVCRADVFMKHSSATFGDNVDVRSELILIPNQKLNRLPVVASELINKRTTAQTNGIRNPPPLQAGLPRKNNSKRIASYSCVLLLFIICTAISVKVLLLQDNNTNIGNVVTREEWNAQPPTCKVDTLTIVPTLVIIHHTVTSECDTFQTCAELVRSVQMNHMNNKDFCDIGYNFLIGGDGRIYEGRGYKGVGAHTPLYNTKTLGLAFIGDFSLVHPNDQQTENALQYLEQTAKHGSLTDNFKICGRNQMSPNSSPGRKLIEDIKLWVRYTADPKKWLQD